MWPSRMVFAAVEPQPEPPLVPMIGRAGSSVLKMLAGSDASEGLVGTGWTSAGGWVTGGGDGLLGGSGGDGWPPEGASGSAGSAGGGGAGRTLMRASFADH